MSFLSKHKFVSKAICLFLSIVLSVPPVLTASTSVSAQQYQNFEQLTPISSVVEEDFLQDENSVVYNAENDPASETSHKSVETNPEQILSPITENDEASQTAETHESASSVAEIPENQNQPNDSDNAAEAPPLNSTETAYWITVDGIVGGDVYFDSATGEIASANKDITVANIPSQINGVNVVSIKDNVFYNHKNLTSATLPDTVTTIGISSFENCDLLTTIDLGDGLTEIGYEAFKGCDALTTIEIPNSVTSIDSYAFASCVQLETIKLGNSVAYIGSYAFQHSVSLQSVILPDSLTKVGALIFYNCTGLKSVTLGNGMPDLPRMFNGCTGLETVVMNDSITSIAHSMFSGCTSLENIVLPANLTTIQANTFEDCTMLKQITIPNGVTDINDNAFNNSGITSIAIPASVENIRSSAFANSDLASITFEGVPTFGNQAFENVTSLKEITIPEGVTEIPLSFFSGCTSLHTVNLPSTLLSIESNSFYNCTSLKYLSIPSSVSNINDEAFVNCGFTTAGPVGGGYGFEFGWTTSIPNSTFDGNNTLVSITIPDTITTIGAYAFRNCTLLTSIELPALTNVGANLFSGCTSLQSVTFTEGITKISSSMFKGCTSLNSITVPSSVTTVYSSAFDGCTSLDSVVFLSEETTFDSETFSGAPLLKTAGPTGGNYNIQFPFTDNVPQYMFSGANALTSVELPSTIKTISSYAFKDTLFTNITLPEGLETIGTYAFYNSALEEVIIPDSVTEVSNYAFSRSDKLHTVIFGSGVKTLNSQTFYYCTMLTKIILPANLEKIQGSYVFSNTALTELYIPESVTSIYLFAFMNMPSGFTIIVFPGSYSETFAIENNFLYKYIDHDSNSLTVNLPIGDYSGNTLKVTEKLTNNHLYIKTANTNTYIIGGLKSDNEYIIELINPYGEILGSVSTTIVKDQDNIAEITNITDTYTVSLDITATGVDISGKISTRFYMVLDSEVKHISSLASVSNLTLGTQIAYEIVLNDELASKYITPPSGKHTVTSSNNQISVTLQEIEDITITGRAVNEKNTALRDVDVTLMQKVGEKNIVLQATTDASGNFSISAKNIPGTLSLSKADYVNLQIEKDNWSNASIGDLTLNEISGVAIKLNVLYKSNIYSGEDALISTATNADNLSFTIYNETKKSEVTNVSFQYPSIIVLDSSVVSGDKLTISVFESSGQYNKTSASTTVVGEKAEIELLLTENGKARFLGSTSKNAAEVAIVYTSTGEYVATYDYEGLIAETAPLASGSYTVISMGKSEAFNSIGSLSDISSVGLVEGTDYISNTFSISSGFNTSVNISEIPQFNDIKFYYTDATNTYSRASSNSAVHGKVITFSSKITFKDEYKDRVSNVSLVVELPASMQLIEGAVYADRAQTPHTYIDNDLTFAVDSEHILYRYCAEVVDIYSGSTVDTWLEFTLDGNLIRQPIGSTNIKLEDFSYTIPKKVNNTELQLLGKISPNTTLQVFDNNRLIGEVSSNVFGDFSANVTLASKYDSEVHIINFIQTENGKEVYKSNDYYVNYDTSNSVVESITFSSQSRTYSLDFNDYSKPLTSYTIMNTLLGFTYEIKFTGSVSDVVLHLKDMDGEDVTSTATYQEDTNSWAVYVPGVNPTSIGVSYNDNYQPEKTIEEYNDENEYLDLIMEKITSDGNANPYGYTVTETTDTSFKADLFWDDEVYGSDILATMEMKVLDYADYSNIDLEDAGFVQSIYDSTHYVKVERPNTNLEIYTTVTTSGTAFQTIYDYTPIYNAIWEDYSTEESEFSASYEGVEASSVAVKASPLKWIGLVSDTIDLVKEAAPYVDFGTELYSMIDFIDETNTKLLDMRDYINTLANAKCKDGTPRLDNPSLYLNQPVMDDVLDYQEDMIKEMMKYAAIWAVDKKFELTETKDFVIMVYDILSFSGKYTAWEVTQKVTKGIGNLAYKQLKNELPNVTKEIFEPVEDVLNIYDAVTGGLAAAYKQVDVSSQRRTMSKTYAQYNAQLKLLELQIKEAYKDCSADDPEDMLSATAPSVPDISYPFTIAPIIDPSGYVYEAVPSNRLPGVTTTVYEQVTEVDIFDQVTTYAKFWDAEKYAQQNPLTTNELGRYAWDVPTGNWQVKYELEGYETTYSEWLPVPPPQLEVNIPMTSYEKPTIQNIVAYQNGIVIEFSKYMELSDLTLANISVTKNGENVSGSIKLVNTEETADGSSSYASKIEFTPSTNLVVNDIVTVTIDNNVKSYAGVYMQDIYSGTDIPVTLRPESIELSSDVVNVNQGDNSPLTITLAPAQAVAGKTLLVQSVANGIAEVAESVVIQSDGTAVLNVAGNLPGISEFTLLLEGTDIQKTVTVNVATVKAPPTVGTISGAVTSYNENKDILVVLSDGTNNVSYTLKSPIRSFVFTDLSAATYSITISQQGHKDTVISDIVLSQGENKVLSEISKIELIGGDANGDDIVNSDDMLFITQLYNSSIDAQTSAYDVNGDGLINFLDVSIIRNSKNFGQ